MLFDDDDAIIEQLLDSLDEQPKPKSRLESKLSVAADTKTLTEEAQELLGLLGNEVDSSDDKKKAESECWSSLLNHFCADGDERVVDELLDNFLGSQCDASKLIDALSKAMPASSSVAAPEPKQKKAMFLDLGGVQGLQSFDALLGSARGVMQSARTSSKPKRRAQSAHPTSQKAKKPRPKSAHPALCSVAPEEPSSGASSCDQQQQQQQPTTVDQEAPPCPEACEDGGEPRPGVKLLARIAEMDDPDAMRNFMKRFLLGVRRRCIAGMQDEVWNEGEGCTTCYSDSEDGSVMIIDAVSDSERSEYSNYD